MPTISIEKAKLKLHSKPIAQYDLKGRYLRTFKSASEAAREANDAQSNVSSVASGKRGYSGKYQYAYIDNGKIPSKNPVVMADNISKCVLKLDKISGQVLAEYESVGAAAKAVLGSQSNISTCINGRKKSAYGYKWKFK